MKTLNKMGITDYVHRARQVSKYFSTSAKGEVGKNALALYDNVLIVLR